MTEMPPLPPMSPPQEITPPPPRKSTIIFPLMVVLMVCIFFVVLLMIAILLPTFGRARELARQSMCQANLNGMGKAIAMYGSENNDAFPILPGINTKAASYDASLRVGGACDADNLGQGVQQNLCLLVKNGTAAWNMFLCPSSSTQELKRDASSAYGFGDGNKTCIDYGLQIAYRGDPNNPGNPDYPNKAAPSPQLDPGVVIMADKADPTDLVGKWSRNHPRDGENVLYMGLKVLFSKNKTDNTHRNTGGWGGNNIYTQDRWTDATDKTPTLIDNGASVGFPASTKDSVIYSK